MSARRRPGSLSDARARLHDAEAFFEVAETVADPDVRATNAIHAAIAAADAICCAALRERSADVDHRAAVDLLRRVDSELANHLGRALARKTQAAYESRDIASGDASACVRHARQLLESARERILNL